MDKEVGKISKGEFQGTSTEVIVAIREYNGRVGVDIREYTTSDKYTGPTKKGLRIPADRFQEFKDMINSISQGDLVTDGSGSSENSSRSSYNNSYGSGSSGYSKPGSSSGQKKIKTEKPGYSSNDEDLPDY